MVRSLVRRDRQVTAMTRMSAAMTHEREIATAECGVTDQKHSRQYNHNVSYPCIGQSVIGTPFLAEAVRDSHNSFMRCEVVTVGAAEALKAHSRKTQRHVPLAGYMSGRMSTVMRERSAHHVDSKWAGRKDEYDGRQRPVHPTQGERTQSRERCTRVSRVTMFEREGGEGERGGGR